MPPRHWGEGGSDFHWWCTEAREAFGGTVPVYRHMRSELIALIGSTVYHMLAGFLDARSAVAAKAVPLPHPALRAP